MEREQSLEKTLQAARLAEISKQHMESLKEGSSRIEKVNLEEGKGHKPLRGRLVGDVVFDTHQIHVLLFQTPEVTAAPEVPTDDDLTETEFEPTFVEAAPEHPGIQPAEMSITAATRSDRIIRGTQRFKDSAGLFSTFHLTFCVQFPS